MNSRWGFSTLSYSYPASVWFTILDFVSDLYIVQFFVLTIDILEGPKWGTEVNEPGGRLFGEPILKPGESRVWFDWELPIYLTFGTAFLMLSIGLSSQPPNSPTVRNLIISFCLFSFIFALFIFRSSYSGIRSCVLFGRSLTRRNNYEARWHFSILTRDDVFIFRFA